MTKPLHFSQRMAWALWAIGFGFSKTVRVSVCERADGYEVFALGKRISQEASSLERRQLACLRHPDFSVDGKWRMELTKAGVAKLWGYEMIEHPGRTKAERRILDEVGNGNRARTAVMRMPGLQGYVRKLLADGLLVEAGDVFEMPVAVHIRWCDYWSEQKDFNS